MKRIWRWIRPRLFPIETALEIRNIALEEAAVVCHEFAQRSVADCQRDSALICAELIRRRKTPQS